MPRLDSESNEPTYPVGTIARLTGLSPELLRAWERRHGVVEPRRTAGGTRRYSTADLERLRLVKAAVDAGHRIGQVAQLDASELRRRTTVADPGTPGGLDEVLRALHRLDDAESQRLLSLQLSLLGAPRFARDVAIPLVSQIGDRWAAGSMGIASEHLGTSILRSLLGSALRPTASSLTGPRIVFATPSGERHELGLLMAALTVLGAGANPLYLGAELPLEDILSAVESSRSTALAVSLVAVPEPDAVRTLITLYDGLPMGVPLFVGGCAAANLSLPSGVEYIESLEHLEQRVKLLSLSNWTR